MNETFSAIIGKHEADDTQQAKKEELFLSAVRTEFANGEALLREAERLSLTPQDFMTGKITELPILPVRTCGEFYIKKHTTSQIPYFHGHDYYEMIYVHEGRCLQKFKDRPNLPLTKKQCCLLPPGTVHSIGRCGDADVVFKLGIPRTLFAETAQQVLGEAPKEAKIFESVSENAEHALLKLLQCQARNGPFRRLYTQSCLTLLFIELVSVRQTDYALEERLNAYFGENIGTASLADFAARLNYNANYLSRLIKIRTGESFSVLLARYRINRAKRLLSESGLSVENIASETGYSDPSGFYKQFYASLGMTPAEYRKLLR